MDALISFIMGSDTTLTVSVAIRLAITFATIDMIKAICVNLIKGVKA
jgi:hypothetical protein